MISQEGALREYARMLNTSNPECFLPLLDEDFIYESQMVIKPLVSKESFEEYIVAKLAAIKKSGSTVYAEMGTISAFFKEQPCTILAQGKKDNLVAVVLATVDDNRLVRIDLCCVAPSPELAMRSGDYPS